MNPEVKKALRRGVVIPASPLALTASRKLDERRQRALFRYYIAAGAGGLAVGVHTTEFAIRKPKIGLFQPVLELAAEETTRAAPKTPAPLVRIAGVCGQKQQAIREASLIQRLGYDAALLSLGAWKSANEDELLAHCEAVAEIIPLVGFYLQTSVGGRPLPFSFWRRFAEIENVVAIKIAPFNRYQTIDVVRAVAEAGRSDIALYTGNDDNIVLDLITPYRFPVRDRKTRRIENRASPSLPRRVSSGSTRAERRIVGGLLGQWAVWTHKAVELLAHCQRASEEGAAIPSELLQRNIELTDANAAIFDAGHVFAGCIPGIHEILRRQGLLKGIWCLDPDETLSRGQSEDIDRVCRAYPHLTDDAFVEAHREEWLRG
jgi:hypothetical protein